MNLWDLLQAYFEFANKTGKKVEEGIEGLTGFDTLATYGRRFTEGAIAGAPLVLGSALLSPASVPLTAAGGLKLLGALGGLSSAAGTATEQLYEALGKNEETAKQAGNIAEIATSAGEMLYGLVKNISNLGKVRSGDFLRALGITADDVADPNIARRTLAKLADREFVFPRRMVKRIAEVLDIDPKELRTFFRNPQKLAPEKVRKLKTLLEGNLDKIMDLFPEDWKGIMKYVMFPKVDEEVAAAADEFKNLRLEGIEDASVKKMLQPQRTVDDAVQEYGLRSAEKLKAEDVEKLALNREILENAKTLTHNAQIDEYIGYLKGLASQTKDENLKKLTLKLSEQVKALKMSRATPSSIIDDFFATNPEMITKLEDVLGEKTAETIELMRRTANAKASTAQSLDEVGNAVIETFKEVAPVLDDADMKQLAGFVAGVKKGKLAERGNYIGSLEAIKGTLSDILVKATSDASLAGFGEDLVKPLDQLFKNIAEMTPSGSERLANLQKDFDFFRKFQDFRKLFPGENYSDILNYLSGGKLSDEQIVSFLSKSPETTGKQLYLMVEQGVIDPSRLETIATDIIDFATRNAENEAMRRVVQTRGSQMLKKLLVNPKMQEHFAKRGIDIKELERNIDKFASALNMQELLNQLKGYYVNQSITAPTLMSRAGERLLGHAPATGVLRDVLGVIEDQAAKQASEAAGEVVLLKSLAGQEDGKKLLENIVTKYGPGTLDDPNLQTLKQFAGETTEFLTPAARLGGKREGEVESVNVDTELLERIKAIAKETEEDVILKSPVAPEEDWFEGIKVRGKKVKTKQGREIEIDDPTIYGLLKTESNFDEEAVSDKGAVGIAQFLPSTAREYGINPLDPIEAIKGAKQYLADSMQEFGDEELALASYLFGRGAIKKALEKYKTKERVFAMLPEAKNYVDKILTFRQEF